MHILKHSNILLVDDDEDDQEIFLDIVNGINKGVDCAVASNGQEALNYLKNHQPPPDMIFMDLNMPVMTGIDCLSILKKEDSYKNIPVVIFTTSSNPADIEKTKNLGVNVFFTKPSDFDKLYSNLQHLLTSDIAGQFVVL